MGALHTVHADRERELDGCRRAARGWSSALRCAYAHGTVAIRTHLDFDAAAGAISWPVLAELREAWAGRIELQAVSLAMIEHYAGDGRAEALADRWRRMAACWAWCR